MKNIYLFVLSFVLITSANSQVIRYTLMDVDSKDREKFETALANKTKIYNSKKGQQEVYTFSITSGKDVYKYVRVVVNESFGDFGNNQRNTSEGVKYFRKNVGPYAENLGSYFMKLNKAASYTPNNDEFQKDVNFRRVYLYDYKDSHREDFWRFRIRYKKALEKMGGKRMGVLTCLSGCAGNKVMVRYHFNDPKDDEDFLGKNLSKLVETYNEIFGGDSYKVDIQRMWNSLESKRVWHELRRNKLSSPF